MLTRLSIRNFKRFDRVDIELGRSVVFIGPNNSGKTTALQALALWDVGLRQWNAKRGGKASPEKRPGVTINRRDLISIPVPVANLLWRDLHVREGREPKESKPRTANIRIEVAVAGITSDTPWTCGLEFDYSNEESFVCRGLQQTLLLLAHLYANPNTVLLLDEPDAHLELFRQRQTYRLISELATRQNSQVLCASHSEVVLSEAAGRGTVVAFVGRPHTMNDRGSQVVKSLNDIGWDQYYQAEERGWVLYLEGPTDLAILQAFAAILKHDAAECLERPFVHYVATHLPQRAREHFFGLREVKSDLVGIAVFDRLDSPLQAGSALVEVMWNRREIENYLCSERVLLAFAAYDQPDDLFGLAERRRREQAMRESIREVADALRTLSRPDPWSPDTKATDEFLDPLFRTFFARLGLPLTFRKSDYHVLAKLVARDAIDPDVVAKLDAIVAVAKKARPTE